MSVFDILVRYRVQFLGGLAVTLQMSLLIWSVGLVVGTLLGAAGARWRWAVGMPSGAISFVLGGMPVLVFLFWLHYPAQSLLGIVVEPFYTATLALSILNTVLVADLVRGALIDFPAQYVQAAMVTGLSSRDIVLRVQLPMISRQILPGLLLVQVSMMQATLFASLISVDEIFRIAQRINSEVYRPVQIYSALAVFFLLTCLPITGVALWLRNRFTRDVSER